jgi:methionyl-tRNA synthetase
MVKEEVNRGEKILVTAALPYANGSIHLGHLVEYIQADVYVRFLKLSGKDAVFVCADDTHGTPIEIAASKQNIKPEELIAKYHAEHQEDFSAFNIKFDIFHSTNSPENKAYSDFFFNKLTEDDYIYKKLIELTYCEHCKRFLPDRYVKGKCPKCNEEEQYGDQCEKCNATYQPTELVEPHCVICGAVPTRKESLHYFFKLSAFSKQLEEWIISNENIQDDAKNFVLNWIKSGLEDWDISRDGPYFGFKIPGEVNKYYYVWLDAPIGYVAATEKLTQTKFGKTAIETYWQNDTSKIVHFIGKDIIYFHLLFWPAILKAAEFKLPSSYVVHGHLTIDGEKMSKSRGNFLTANDYLSTEGHDPEFLRFYYASNLNKTITDINLDFNDFKEKINNDLVGNIANFIHRTLVFTNNNFNSKLGDLEKEEKEFLKKLEPKYEEIKNNYDANNLRETVKGILELGSIGNRYFQDNAPWKLIKTDKKQCHKVVTVAANIVKNIALLSAPIMPKYSEKTLRVLKIDLRKTTLSALTEPLEKKEILKSAIIFAPIEKTIAIKDSFPVLLKVGKIMEIDDHPEADKLYLVKVNLGTGSDPGKPEVRQLVAGLKPYYAKEDLLGKKIIVVSNLKPAKLRGELSEGMLLAADDGNKVKVISPENSELGEVVYPEDSNPEELLNSKRINIEDFLKLGLKIKDEKVVYGVKPLKTNSEVISVDAEDDAVVR